MLDSDLTPATGPDDVATGAAGGAAGGATSATRAGTATATRRPTHPAADGGRRPLHASVTQDGPRNQPRRAPRSKR